MAAPYYQNKEVIEKNDVAVFSSNYNLYGDLSARVMDTLRELVGATTWKCIRWTRPFSILLQYQMNNVQDGKRIKETVEEWTV
jgi:DNA polymerase V